MARTTLRLSWIESFLAVIDSGGVEARAAEALGISASTVNRDIGALDAWLGWVTFNGDFPRELTQDGRNFEDTAREVRRLLTEARATRGPL
jgi:DNA-binding transcriptional LysR family regulator